MTFSFENNVLSTLAAAIGTGDDAIVVVDAVAPRNNFPDPGTIAIAILTDDRFNPTKIEIVTYTDAADNGNGTHTLSGVSRGAEGTMAQSWAAGTPIFQDATAASLVVLHDSLPDYDPLEHVDWSADQGALNIHVGNITLAAVQQHSASLNHDALLNAGGNQHEDWTASALNFATTGEVTAKKVNVISGAGHANMGLEHNNQKFTFRCSFSNNRFVILDVTWSKTPFEVAPNTNSALMQLGVSAADRVDINGKLGIQGGGALVALLRKTADETAPSSTLKNDGHLVYPAAANDVLFIEYFLIIAAKTTPAFKFDIAVPSGASAYYNWSKGTGSTLFSPATAIPVDGADLGRLAVRILCWVYMGSTAGNVQLRWAQQNTDGANPATVYKASSMKVWQ